MAQFIPTKLYKTNHDVEPDDYDKGMVGAYIDAWNSHFRNDPDTPRVGDYVITPDGKYQRAAYIWPDQVQTCDGGSFYLGNGYASMSGGLDPGFKKEKLVPTGERKAGHFWTFHHNYAQAHSGIGISCSCRVFKVVP